MVLGSDIPVVIDFWAPWCGPCRIMAPVIEQLADKADGEYAVGKVNVDEQEELSDRCRIMSIPTIRVFKDGRPVASAVGVTTTEKILQMVRNQ